MTTVNRNRNVENRDYQLFYIIAADFFSFLFFHFKYSKQANNTHNGFRHISGFVKSCVGKKIRNKNRSWICRFRV